eukprot:c9533_g1_i2.p1 GENE.c9533_g1_i2~~c9533_g1_i2.p1  ORF type:complete len:374 (-),score=96.48 c9533_g1_i2:18-1139(-)
MWDLARRKALWHVPKAHEGAINGIVFSRMGDRIFTCGADKTVKLFVLNASSADQDEEDEDEDEVAKRLPTYLKSLKPDKSWMAPHSFSSIDHHWSLQQFATTGAKLSIWDMKRSTPIHSFAWGTEVIKTVRYNAVERDLLATAGSDNSIVLYDARLGTPTQKVVLKMRTNSIMWNPMEAINFIAANEDSNVYSFDMRKLSSAICVHRGHVAAVIDVAFAPTGLEFVSAGYDRTIRIFGSQASNSREVYHTKRMGRVQCVRYSGDAKYVLSGSDDHNIRLWKANASAPIRQVTGAEKRKLEYGDKLKERYQHVPEISRILKHRHLPRQIHNSKRRLQTMSDAAKKKLDNRRKHSKPGTVQPVPERKKHVTKVIE